MIKILLGITMIIGGITGQLILRGTQGRWPILIGGVVFLSWGIYNFLNKDKNQTDQ